MSYARDLTIDARPEGVRLTGELDAHGAPDVHTALSDLVGRGTGDVEVDVSGLEFIDSVGLGALIKAAGQLERQGRRLHLVGAGGAVRKIIETTGVGERLGLEA